jgi:hypothetical protein
MRAEKKEDREREAKFKSVKRNLLQIFHKKNSIRELKSSSYGHPSR